MKPETRAKIESLTRETLAAKKIPGLTLAIVENRALTYTGAFGVTSLATQEPMRVDSLFHLASVTKLFVGTALMQLAERRQIDLDAPVVRYVPYFKLHDPRANEITLRQMLTHTSGMPDTNEYGWEHPEYDDEALERYVRSLGGFSLIAAPNTKYSYSNIAYEVLGDVIAKVSGVTFEEFVAQNILRPLGMLESTLLVREANPNLLTTPHTQYLTGSPIVSSIFPYNRAHAPSSTLYSNIGELSRFALCYLNQGELDNTRILNANTIYAMWTPAFPREKSYWKSMGLAWHITERQGQRIVGHGGEDVGFGSSLMMAPERGLALVYLSNSDGSLFDDTGDAILDELLLI